MRTRDLAAAVCLAAAACGAAPALAEDKPSLVIEARLFGSKTGKLSENVLAPGGPALGNVVIGDDPSVSTFVTVKVSGGRTLGDRARIRMLAVEGEKPALWKGAYRPRRLVDKAVARPLFDDGQEAAYVGFWIQPTGCVPVELTVELSDPPSPMVTSTAKLDFRCYE